MKEAILLVAVEGIVGGVEVEGDGVGRLGVGLQEQFHQQRLQGLGVMVDVVVAVGAYGWGQVQVG